jgi:hypothetical protein
MNKLACFFFFFFFCCCPIGVCAILEKVVQVDKRFLLTSRGFWQATSLLFNKSFHVFHVRHVLTFYGKILPPLVFVII